MADPMQAVGSIANLFGGVMSGISGQQALDWLHGLTTNNLNFGRQGYGDWTQRYDGSAEPARNQALGFGNTFGSMAQGALGPYMDNASALQGLIPGLLQQYGGSFGNEQTGGAAQGLGALMGGAGNIFGNGGWTPQNASLFGQGQDFATGSNDPMRAFSNIGQNLLNTSGGTDFNFDLMNTARDSVKGGGMTDLLRSAMSGAQGIQAAGGSTPDTQQGIQQALQMLMNGGSTQGTRDISAAGRNALQGNLGVSGLTNTGAVGELAALQGIQNEGKTALSSSLQQKAMEILSTNPTISLEQAVSMARDAAATAAAQQGKTARARALARGGGPGAIVASGSQNEAMTDFADQALQAEAGAGRDALMKQQGVLSDREKTGASLGLGAGGLQGNTLGTYADLLKGLEGVAANRFGTGGSLLGQGTALETDRAQTGFSGLSNLGGLETQRLLSALGLQPTIQNSATNSAGTMGQLGLGGASDQNARMNTGSNMLQQWLNSALSGSGLSQQSNTSAQNYGLGAGGLMGGAANNLGSLGLGQGSLGQSNFQNIFNAMNQGVNQQGNALNAAVGGQQALSTNPLLQLAGQAQNTLGMFGNNTSQMPSVPGSNNSWGALAGRGR